MSLALTLQFATSVVVQWLCFYFCYKYIIRFFHLDIKLIHPQKSKLNVTFILAHTIMDIQWGVM